MGGIRKGRKNKKTKANPQTKGDGATKQHLSKSNRVSIWIPVMINVLLILGTVGLALSPVFYSINHKSTSVWVLFASLCIYSLTMSLYLQEQIWKQEEAARVVVEQTKPVEPPLAAPARPELEQPTFRESSAFVDIKMGTSHWNYPFADLLDDGVVPRPFGRPLPVRLYLDPETYKIYTDATISAGSSQPAVELKRNVITTLRQSWDYNSNASALEVVNENQQPVFQLIYKAPSRIEINGIFVVPGGTFAASDTGATYNPDPKTYSLKRIFKYPSWKYKGEYENP